MDINAINKRGNKDRVVFTAISCDLTDSSKKPLPTTAEIIQEKLIMENRFINKGSVLVEETIVIGCSHPPLTQNPGSFRTSTKPRSWVPMAMESKSTTKSLGAVILSRFLSAKKPWSGSTVLLRLCCGKAAIEVLVVGDHRRYLKENLIGYFLWRGMKAASITGKK